jgi:hypothetical protein
MGPPSFLRSVVHRNVVMRRIPVYVTFVITLSSNMMVYKLRVWISAVKYSVVSVILLSHLFRITKYSPSLEVCHLRCVKLIISQCIMCIYIHIHAVETQQLTDIISM